LFHGAPRNQTKIGALFWSIYGVKTRMLRVIKGTVALFCCFVLLYATASPANNRKRSPFVSQTVP
jgi:hypothetical protein